MLFSVDIRIHRWLRYARHESIGKQRKGRWILRRKNSMNKKLGKFIFSPAMYMMMKSLVCLFHRVFDQFAAAIIDRCYENDRNFSLHLVRRPAVSFYNAYPLKLALKADCRSFLASNCVQHHLDDEWWASSEPFGKQISSSSHAEILRRKFGQWSNLNSMIFSL